MGIGYRYVAPPELGGGGLVGIMSHNEWGAAHTSSKSMDNVDGVDRVDNMDSVDEMLLPRMDDGGFLGDGWCIREASVGVPVRFMVRHPGLEIIIVGI